MRDIIRRTVIFSGNVQGVGFRWNVVDSVGEAAVTGTVRNLEDGSVEAIFEGPPVEIEKILNCVRRRMAGHIAAERATDGSATNEFEGFAIRR